MLAAILILLLSGKLRFEREVKEKVDRIVQLETEIAGWKQMAFGTLRMGEQVTEVVKRQEFP